MDEVFIKQRHKTMKTYWKYNHEMLTNFNNTRCCASSNFCKYVEYFISWVCYPIGTFSSVFSVGLFGVRSPKWFPGTLPSGTIVTLISTWTQTHTRGLIAAYPPGADLCLESEHGCEHICESSPGSFHCLCLPGYTLNPDGKTCAGKWLVATVWVLHCRDQDNGPPSFTQVFQCEGMWLQSCTDVVT